jgi:RNA polymerase sigma-70 factor (ECF subfamily)
VSDAGRRDSDLVEALARGDEGAIRSVIDEFTPLVRNTARRVVRDHTLAEDVVQDTFVALWSEPGRYDSTRGSLAAFLTTVAHRRAIDVVRSEVARSNREQRPPEPPPPIDIEEEVWTLELSRTVRQQLEKLPEGEREAISLAYLAGLPYVTVAERLGLPEGTVKSRIRSGMRRLARILADLAP